MRGILYKAIIFLAFLLLIGGCGYHLVSIDALPYKTVHLAKVENRTYEPGLKRGFIESFTETCLENGIDLSAEGPEVRVILTDYDLVVRSLKNSLSSEYSVVIKADVSIFYPDGNKHSIKGLSSEFDESFIAGQSVEEINTQRQRVLRDALKDLSKRILNEVLYNGIQKAQ